jgi:glycosyltransferase involved in cell wall biosynthesis
MCGRLWDEGKGAAVLDRAAARLSAPVFAAGPLQGPGTGQVAFAHLQTLGALTGDAVRARMAEAAVFCSPALYEPFGLAVLEAAQAGAPLLLSDIPSFRELWDGAAVFTPAGDSVALGAALEALLADPGRRERLSAAARQRASRYTLDAMVDGTLAAYRDLVPVRAAA